MGQARRVPEGLLGARFHEKGTSRFTVWAPFAKSVAVRIAFPETRVIPMVRNSRGYWNAISNGLVPGARYLYRLNDEKDRPDPASRFQPEGVHGPSQLVDPGEFDWNDDDWHGMPFRDLVIYEVHIGAFTPAGTFEAAVSRLDHLKDLGVTAIEIMPVAQFPGNRNWGYDGVYPFAPQNTYGGPQGLKALVNACHRQGIAVILDVVYNHLGPDGNYLGAFGPYFTAKYRTPWGEAVNFDGPYSDEVRTYFSENALYWVTEYHVDGLRLDAIDKMYDFGARHFLAQLAETVHRRADALERQIFLFAESDLNDVRVINPAEMGGYGIDAQWNDDFHHALHALVSGERTGYYQDFGTIEHLAKAFREGFVYSGEYSRYRKRKHGNSSKGASPRRFVVYSQNHDQVGNRVLGERLSAIATFEQHKLAASCVILSPFVPLLFMGEEYSEPSPFQYFVDHADETLVKAVREGRSSELAPLSEKGTVPDPQDENTFQRSKIDPGLRRSGKHKILFEYYRALLRMRRSLPALSDLRKEAMEVTGYESERALLIRGCQEGNQILILFSFNDDPMAVSAVLPPGTWHKLIDSSSSEWGGTSERAEQTVTTSGGEVLFQMNHHSAVLYARQEEVP